MAGVPFKKNIPQLHGIYPGSVAFPVLGIDSSNGSGVTFGKADPSGEFVANGAVPYLSQTLADATGGGEEQRVFARKSDGLPFANSYAAMSRARELGADEHDVVRLPGGADETPAFLVVRKVGMPAGGTDDQGDSNTEIVTMGAPTYVSEELENAMNSARTPAVFGRPSDGRPFANSYAAGLHARNLGPDMHSVVRLATRPDETPAFVVVRNPETSGANADGLSVPNAQAATSGAQSYLSPYLEEDVEPGRVAGGFGGRSSGSAHADANIPASVVGKRKTNASSSDPVRPVLRRGTAGGTRGGATPVQRTSAAATSSRKVVSDAKLARLNDASSVARGMSYNENGMGRYARSDQIGLVGEKSGVPGDTASRTGSKGSADACPQGHTQIGNECWPDSDNPCRPGQYDWGTGQCIDAYPPKVKSARIRLLGDRTDVAGDTSSRTDSKSSADACPQGHTQIGNECWPDSDNPCRPGQYDWGTGQCIDAYPQQATYCNTYSKAISYVTDAASIAMVISGSLGGPVGMGADIAVKSVSVANGVVSG